MRKHSPPQSRSRPRAAFAISTPCSPCAQSASAALAPRARNPCWKNAASALGLDPTLHARHPADPCRRNCARQDTEHKKSPAAFGRASFNPSQIPRCLRILRHADAGSQHALNLFFDHILRHIAHNLISHLAALEEQAAPECRESRTATALRRSDPRSPWPPSTGRHTSPPRVHSRPNRLAGAAPDRPEIHQHRLLALEHFLVKRCIAHFQNSQSSHDPPRGYRLPIQCTGNRALIGCSMLRKVATRACAVNSRWQSGLARSSFEASHRMSAHRQSFRANKSARILLRITGARAALPQNCPRCEFMGLRCE